MYSVEVRDAFVAHHFLFGGDWGQENEWHGHRYSVEVQLNGPCLDQHQYLVDIESVKSALSGVIDYFRNATLNELPEFEQRNPSLEVFARVFAQRFTTVLESHNVEMVVIRMWEDEIASATFTLAMDDRTSKNGLSGCEKRQTL